MKAFFDPQRLSCVKSCIIVSTFSLLGCKKIPVSMAGPGTDFTNGYTIYMAGTDSVHAAYWKDGKEVLLENNADALGIVVSGTDLYVCGSFSSGADLIAAYWKNGNQVPLANSGTSHCYGIAVSGSDVYCVGDKFGPNNSDSAIYWKNGISFNLAPNSKGSGESIAVSGSSVLIAGQIIGIVDTAVSWINGDPTYNWMSSQQPFWGVGAATIYGVTVSGMDTFMVGNIGNQAALWKNGTLTILADYGYAAAVSISGSDIYVSGGVRNGSGNIGAAYWKNSVLTTLGDNYLTSQAGGIAIAGTDIYVVGDVFDGRKFIPVYWKNDIMKALANQGDIASILVMK